MQKKITKLIAALMVLCMMLTVVVVSPTSVVAADSGSIVLELDNESPTQGETITVTISSVTINGTEYTSGSIPSNYAMSVWYQDEDDWRTPINGKSDTWSTTIEVSADNFSVDTTYTVQAALYNKSDWNTPIASTSVTFTVTEDTSTSSDDRSATIDTDTIYASDSITITFGTEATSSNYYEVQVASTGWDKYINVYVKEGSTYTIKGSEINDGTIGTYIIWIGYYTNNTYVGKSLSSYIYIIDGVTNVKGYSVTIKITDTDNYKGVTYDEYEDDTFTAGSYVYSFGETVNVEVVLIDNDTEKAAESFPSGYGVYVWYEADEAYVSGASSQYDNKLARVSYLTDPATTITGQISLSDDYFSTGTNYNVYARINTVDSYDVDTNSYGTMVGTSFTIETTYAMETTMDSLKLNSYTGIYVYDTGDTASVLANFTLTVSGSTGSSTQTVPTGTMLTIWYTDDTGNWYDLVFDVGSGVHSTEIIGDNSTTTLSILASNFSTGNVYTIYSALYNEGGEMLAYDEVQFTIQSNASFYTRTLTLDGSFSVNYYVDMTGVAKDDMEKYSVVFSNFSDDDTGKKTQTAEFNENSYRNDLDEDGTKYYRFTVTVNSTQMAVTFNAALTCTDTSAVTVQTDTGYSIETYCLRSIEKEWAEEELCKSLLNYGGYAQKYFDEDVESDELANAKIGNEGYDTDWSDPVTDGTWEDSNVSSYTVTKEGDVPTALTAVNGSYFWTTLTLTTENVARIYFQADDTDGLKVTLDDEALGINSTTYYVDSANQYSCNCYVEFAVQASKLDDTFTVVVTNGTDTYTIGYSAYAFINSTISDSSSSTDLKNVCKALYFLGKEANAFTNWYTGTT